MKMKWGKWKGVYIKGFAEKVTVAERRHWFLRLTDKYLPGFVIVTCIVATVWIWIKIYQLWMIERWLESF